MEYPVYLMKDNEPPVQTPAVDAVSSESCSSESPDFVLDPTACVTYRYNEELWPANELIYEEEVVISSWQEEVVPTQQPFFDEQDGLVEANGYPYSPPAVRPESIVNLLPPIDSLIDTTTQNEPASQKVAPCSENVLLPYTDQPETPPSLDASLHADLKWDTDDQLPCCSKTLEELTPSFDLEEFLDETWTSSTIQLPVPVSAFECNAQNAPIEQPEVDDASKDSQTEFLSSEITRPTLYLSMDDSGEYSVYCEQDANNPERNFGNCVYCFYPSGKLSLSSKFIEGRPFSIEDYENGAMEAKIFEECSQVAGNSMLVEDERNVCKEAADVNQSKSPEDSRCSGGFTKDEASRKGTPKTVSRKRRRTRNRKGRKRQKTTGN